MSRKRQRLSNNFSLNSSNLDKSREPILNKSTQDIITTSSLKNLEKNFNSKLEELSEKLENLNSAVEKEYSLRDTILQQQHEIFELKYFISNHMDKKETGKNDYNYFT